MKSKQVSVILSWLLLITLSGAILTAVTLPGVMATMNVKIEKDRDSDIWRVRDKDGNNRGTMRVGKKDKINWQAINSEMIFTFKKPVEDYFIYEDSLFADGRSQRIPENKKLRVTIREDAKSDTLYYEVYVVEADTLVVGDSPPKLIIKD